MRDVRFEWDDAKALSNERKHGVTFEAARDVLDDSRALIEPDDATHEERWRHIGQSSSGILFVVVTERGTRTRIIMARRADRHEQDRYVRQALP
jgi:uncharacterized protein